MQLILRSQDVGEVVVLRCCGRIVAGEEAQFLQAEVQRLTQMTKNVVLQLAEVNYIDSGGLGAIVRLLGVLRAARGNLKLCQVPPFALQILNATNLLTVFHPYASEKDAIEAFSDHPQESQETFGGSVNRIVCLDASLDLLAYVRVLLQRSGYDVFTTQYLSDAVTFAKGARTSLVIFGPGLRSKETAVEKFRQSAPNAKLLHLPFDFSTSEADQAGLELVNRVRSLLVPNKA
jgi:anti-sigma B factor antagonist